MLIKKGVKMNLAIFLDNLVCRRIQSNGDVQYIFRFDNGYGASLVTCDGYRIAPLRFYSDDIDYNNLRIGNDLNSDASIDWSTSVSPTTSYGTNNILDALQTISNL